MRRCNGRSCESVAFGAERPNRCRRYHADRLLVDSNIGNDVFDTQLPQSKKADLKAGGSGDAKAKDETLAHLSKKKLKNAAVARVTLNCSAARYPIIGVELAFPEDE